MCKCVWNLCNRNRILDLTNGFIIKIIIFDKNFRLFHILIVRNDSFKTLSGSYHQKCFVKLFLVKKSFIRFKTEYGSVILSPYYMSDIDMLEEIPRKTLIYAASREDNEYSVIEFSYVNLLERFSVPLQSRRKESLDYNFYIRQWMISMMRKYGTRSCLMFSEDFHEIDICNKTVDTLQK